MKIQKLGSAKIIMDNPRSRHRYFGWPTAVRLKNGRIAVAASGFRLRHICPFGIRAMFSRDLGETWETDHVIYETNVSADLGYPSTVELKDGSLLTVFYACPENNGVAVIMQQKWSFAL